MIINLKNIVKKSYEIHNLLENVNKIV